MTNTQPLINASLDTRYRCPNMSHVGEIYAVLFSNSWQKKTRSTEDKLHILIPMSRSCWRIQKWSTSRWHCLFRPWQNNCLVPVTYGPESRVGRSVGRSGNYFIMDNYFMSPIINLPGKMTSAKFGSLTSHTHTHPPLTTRCIESELAWYAAFRQFSLHFGLKYTCRTISFLIQVKIKPKNV